MFCNTRHNAQMIKPRFRSPSFCSSKGFFSRSRLKFLVLSLACGLWFSAAGLARAGEPLGTATIVDCSTTLLRDTEVFKLVEGVRLYPEDIIVSGADSCFIQIEFDDGATLGLGQSTSVMLAPRLVSERANPAKRAYLLHGLLKLRSVSGSAIASPWVDVTATSASAVLMVQPETASVFAESGELTGRAWRPQAAAPVSLKTGEMITWSLSAKPALRSRPGADFLKALPKPFLETLPARAALFRAPASEVKAKRLGVASYAQIQPWIDAEPALRKSNMARWKVLARNPEIRQALLANLAAHPEWEIVLRPPPAQSINSTASDARPRVAKPTVYPEKGVP